MIKTILVVLGAVLVAGLLERASGAALPEKRLAVVKEAVGNKLEDTVVPEHLVELVGALKAKDPTLGDLNKIDEANFSNVKQEVDEIALASGNADFMDEISIDCDKLASLVIDAMEETDDGEELLAMAAESNSIFTNEDKLGELAGYMRFCDFTFNS